MRSEASRLPLVVQQEADLRGKSKMLSLHCEYAYIVREVRSERCWQSVNRGNVDSDLNSGEECKKKECLVA